MNDPIVAPGKQELIIPLSDIAIPENRARDLDRDWAEALAGVIAAQGLTNPITVRKVEDGYRLVTGLHRLEAFRINGDVAIPVRFSNADNDDEARLEEVMENLGRHELKALDRCHHLYELKQVYEKLHPEAKNGGDRGNQHSGGKERQNEIFAFCQDTAEKVGLSRRSIEMAVAIWKKLSVASRARCAGTWLAGHQTSLKLLSEQSPALQKQVLDILLAEQPQASTVPDALTIIENGRLPSHVEKKFASLSKSIRNLRDEELDSVVAAHEERIIASLKRRGRI